MLVSPGEWNIFRGIYYGWLRNPSPQLICGEAPWFFWGFNTCFNHAFGGAGFRKHPQWDLMGFNDEHEDLTIKHCEAMDFKHENIGFKYQIW